MLEQHWAALPRHSHFRWQIRLKSVGHRTTCSRKDRIQILESVDHFMLAVKSCMHLCPCRASQGWGLTQMRQVGMMSRDLEALLRKRCALLYHVHTLTASIRFVCQVLLSK